MEADEEVALIYSDSGRRRNGSLVNEEYGFGAITPKTL